MYVARSAQSVKWHETKADGSTASRVVRTSRRPNPGSADPGPATDFVDTGPLTLRKEACKAEELEGFYEAIRTHGNVNTRQKSISSLLERSRANPELTNANYRVLEQVASRCRWDYRYHCEPMEAVAFFTGQAAAGNMGRSLDGLVKLGYVHTLSVPRKLGGRPMRFCTVVCSADDRSGMSSVTLRQQARDRCNGVQRAKRNGCEWPLPDEPIPQGEGLNDALNEENLATKEGNPSPRRDANPHHEDQTVLSFTVEEKEVVGERAREAVLVRVDEEPGEPPSVTDIIVGFIDKHTGMGEQAARRALATNVQTFGGTHVADAYAVTVAAMATDIVAKPYQYMLETARRKRDNPQPSAESPPMRQRGPTSKSTIFDRYEAGNV